MSLPDKPKGQYDAGTHAPNYGGGFTLADNSPVAEAWKGPVAKDHTDLERERKEAERLAAPSQPAAPEPPPRPIPQTLADALAVVSRFAGELPGDPDSTAARRDLKVRLAAALPKPGSRAIIGGKNLAAVSEEGEGLTVYLLEQLAVERARVTRLESSLRDMAEAVAVVAHAAKMEMRP